MVKALSRRPKPLLAAAALLIVGTIAISLYVIIGGSDKQSEWTEQELAILSSLSLDVLPPPPPDPSNRFADDDRAAAFGQQLFFDVRFSGNDQVACASCHQPDRTFTDGAQFSTGMGTTGRSAPSVLGAAYTPWLFWDGRKDSLWAQALGPMESPVEHGAARTRYVKIVAKHYKTEYEAIFGALPSDFVDDTRFPAIAGPVPDSAARAAWEAMTQEDRDAVTLVYANMGKAIAAYERRIKPGESKFDTFVKALKGNNTTLANNTLIVDERAGLKLFIGKAKCITCHSGPLLTNNTFHNLNVPGREGAEADPGRFQGIQQVLNDEFNCLSKYSDARPEECTQLSILKGLSEEELKKTEGAFRTTTLRNIVETAPYMHAGQFQTLRQVIEHYNTGIPGQELHLTEQEISQLEAFLHTLSAEVEQPPR